MAVPSAVRSDKTEEKAALNAAKNNVTEKGRQADKKLDEHLRLVFVIQYNVEVVYKRFFLSAMSLADHGAFWLL